ncbi:hypothetical protein HDV05_004878 [Chytridiales sp. JEL 0842]|nr:hypothetical protein HDV05_004878 [Chytridiales sp. JEL 0842]
MNIPPPITPDPLSNWGVIICILKEINDSSPFALPSLSLSAEASIVDTCASVTITQTFELAHNKDLPAAKSDRVVEAVYRFPLPENAAVTSFVCSFNDNTVTAIVKEKEDARRQYTEAVSAGQQASLLEQEKPDVFQISIGNLKLPVSEGRVEKVVAKITYAQELLQNVDADEVRFSLLSKELQDRYGAQPQFSTLNKTVGDSAVVRPSAAGASSVLPPVQISITMANPIRSITSPSHSNVAVHLGSNLTPSKKQSNAAAGAFNPAHAAAVLEADEAEAGKYLSKEMVLVVKADDLNKPRCVVEKHPVDGTHALGLTLVPRFSLNEIRTEIVILVDRSGSMEGGKIKQASKALQILLRSLPTSSYFNIVGFGSSHQMLFPASVEYTPENLQKATSSMENLQADLGGTEILSAVTAVYESRRKDMPTQVLVLTDGEVWDSQSLFTYIKAKVQLSQELNKDAFFRVFALGIGNDVSHDLVEGMARHGGGFAQFVVEGEKLTGKVVKMVKSAVLPPLSDYKVNWVGDWKLMEEDTFELVEKPKKEISLFAKDPMDLEGEKAVEIDYKVDLQVQQAPMTIPNFFPGARFTAYAILAKSVPIPKEVTISAVSPDGPVKLTVPVTEAGEGTLIHTLAARKLIRDIEDDDSCLKHSLFNKTTGQKIDGPIPSAISKKETVRLGMHYGLMSQHTSFVAIHHQKQDNTNKETVVGTSSVPDLNNTGDGMPMANTFFQTLAAPMMLGGAPPVVGAPAPMAMAMPVSSGAPPAFARRSLAMPSFTGIFKKKSVAPPAPAPMMPMASAPPMMAAALMSAPGSVGMYQPPPAPKPLDAKAHLNFDDDESMAETLPFKSNDTTKSLHNLIRLQAFDGSFSLVSICKWLNKPLEEIWDAFYQTTGQNIQLDVSKLQTGLGTAIALKVMKVVYAVDEDEWELVGAKSVKWGERTVGVDLWDALVKYVENEVHGL